MGVVGKVSSLGFYPVKSAYVLNVEKAQCTESGLYLPELDVNDRQYAIVLPDGKLASMKQISRLTLIRPSIRNGSLHLAAPDLPELRIPSVKDVKGGEVRQVSLFFGQPSEGLDCGDEASEWLSKHLGKEGVRLVCLSEAGNKRTLKESGEMIFKGLNIELPEEDPKITYPDFGPYTLISEESVADLNTRLENPVSTLNFRANIVIQGCQAYQEDSLKKIRIGSAEFKIFTMDPRCTVTTVDPETGIRDSKVQPLKTLREYRPVKVVNEVKYAHIAVYMLLTKPGEVKVGDEVHRIE